MKYWYEGKRYDDVDALIDNYCCGRSCGECKLFSDCHCEDDEWIEANEKLIAEKIGAKPDLCELLGVELGEIFTVKSESPSIKYYINHENVMTMNGRFMDQPSESGLEAVLADPLEVVRFEPHPKKVPFISERLGVAPDEAFRVEGMPGVEFKLNNDGSFRTKPAKAVGSSLAILRAIENPDIVYQMSKAEANEVVNSYKARHEDLRLALEVLGK